MNLRKLEPKDAPGMLEWMRDPEINRAFRFDGAHATQESVEAFIYDSHKQKENRSYAIVDDDDVYLGTVSLKKISCVDLTAEYAISLRACAIGTAVAPFATDAILRIAFEELGLRRVYLTVFADNVRACRFYEKYGFVLEGEFKEHLNIRGEWKNVRWYRLMKAEFEEKENERKL